jgi:putative methyltransferase (TIGR04325 family)
MTLAPILLFVYNRPEHTAQTLAALAANELADQSALYIYADGPKPGADEQTLQNIERTRAIIRQKQWCKEVIIIEAEINKGLAASVINGVTEVVNKHGIVIVLEDDIITSKYFLRFMNEALAMYQSEPKALSIGALNFFATDESVPDTFFIPIPDCWGWATWRDRWALFEPNPQKLLDRLRANKLIDKFNLYGAYNFESMLIDQIKGNVNSWAIRWQAVAYLEDKLALYPRYSVTKNIGFGAGGTHGGDDKYSDRLLFAESPILLHKIPVVEDPAITGKMMAGYKQVTQHSGLIKTKLAIRQFIKDCLPPIVSKLYRKAKPHKTNDIMWRGNFKTWAEAKQQCTGYDAPAILEKTKTAILKVKNGEAAFERDTVLFDKADYNWPLLTILLKAANENKGKLSVVDFGGSLGSSYFQNRLMLQGINGLQWSVIEQADYIDVGNNEIADNQLKFYSDIDGCLKERKPNVLLLSSVLQYLEQPYQQLSTLLAHPFEYVIISRTLFIDKADDRITVQQVPKSIYDASYPAWFLNQDKLLSIFNAEYQLLTEAESYPGYTISLDEQTTGHYHDYIFKRADINA